MKKKIFDASCLRIRGSGDYQMKVTKSGHIIFSKEVVDRISLTEKGFVVVQDEERPKDWYIQLLKKGSENSLKLKASDDKRSYSVQCAFITKSILNSLGMDRSIGMQVAEAGLDDEPTLIPIITNSAKPLQSKVAE